MGQGRTETKLFDGKRYKWNTKYKTKAKAKARAEQIKKLGGKARIVKHTKWYVVYVRKT